MNQFLNLIKASEICVDDFYLEDTESKIATSKQIKILQDIQQPQIDLLELLEEKTKELEIYRFRVWDRSPPFLYEVVDFIISQTRDGDWLGFIPHCIDFLNFTTDFYSVSGIILGNARVNNIMRLAIQKIKTTSNKLNQG